MELLSTLLSFVAVVEMNLALKEEPNRYDPEDKSVNISVCGSRLANGVIEVCKPFGGIAKKRYKKRSGPSGKFLILHKSISQRMELR